MNEIFEKINKLIDITQTYIFINNKIFASAKSLKSLKEKIKTDFDNPDKDIKCFIVTISIHPDYKFPLTINCSQYTITPKLSLLTKDDDVSQTFTYTDKELKEYDFKLSHINDIIKSLKKDLVSFDTSSVTITSVFKSLQKQPKPSITNDDIKKLIDEVKNAKTEKIDTESIQQQINEVEKLLKSKPKALKELVKADKEHIKYHPSKMDKEELKLDTKIMKQAKEYTHKVKNVSEAVKNYVDQYIDIYKNSKTPQSRSKKLNDLKLNVYTNLKPLMQPLS
jgi:hypothetical protein